jgi:hypothetical protein
MASAYRRGERGVAEARGGRHVVAAPSARHLCRARDGCTEKTLQRSSGASGGEGTLCPNHVIVWPMIATASRSALKIAGSRSKARKTSGCERLHLQRDEITGRGDGLCSLITAYVERRDRYVDVVDEEARSEEKIPVSRVERYKFSAPKSERRSIKRDTSTRLLSLASRTSCASF